MTLTTKISETITEKPLDKPPLKALTTQDTETLRQAVDAPERFATSVYGSPASTSRAACHRCAIASSSDSVQRSRKNRSPSSALSSVSVASRRSLISGVRHSCRPSLMMIS